MRPDRHHFVSRRRRPMIAPGASYGFLRTTRRHEEEQRSFVERLREEPELRREYRTSLLVQMAVVGVLFLAMLALAFQSWHFLHALRMPRLAGLGWTVPTLAGLLALVVLRRFLRLLADYRRLRGD